MARVQPTARTAGRRPPASSRYPTAMMAKEMYPAPTAMCDRFALEELLPSAVGRVFIVRNAAAAQDP